MGTVKASQSLTVTSTNSSAGTAKVRYTVKCTTTGDSYNYYTQTGTFYINGIKYTNTYNLPENTTTTVFNKEVTIENASGKTISASYSFPTTPYYGTLTGNKSVTIPVLIKTPIISSLTLKSNGLNSVKIAYTLGDTASKIFYKLSTSSTYTQIATNTKTGEFTVSGLNPNTSYTINFLARNISGSDSVDATKSISIKTYDIAKITSAPNIIHGNNLNLTISNPANASLSLKVSVGSTQILTKTLSTGNNSIAFSDSELDNIYKRYGNTNTVTLNCALTTNSNSSWTNTVNVVSTLQGNQKTGYVNISNVWYRSKKWVNINGTWKRCVRWVNVDGIWKRCI